MLPLLPVSALATASASPFSYRQETSLDYPARSTARAFTLIANTTSAPNPIFNPPIGNWVISTSRITPGGQWAVVLSHDTSTNPATLFFVNGTVDDIHSEKATIMSPPIEASGYGAIPLGLQFTTYANRTQHLEVRVNTTGAEGAVSSPIYLTLSLSLLNIVTNTHTHRESP